MNALTAIQQAAERVGPDHERSLALRAEMLVKGLTTTTEFATQSPQNRLNRAHPECRYWRAQRVRALAKLFDAYIREFEDFDDTDRDFSEPFLNAAEIVAERMEQMS